MALPSDVSADLFRAIAEFTYDWESWVDQHGSTRWINAAVERITGYSVEECLALPDYPLSLAHEADRRLLRDVLADAACGGSGNDIEFRIVPRRGPARWVAISWQSVSSSQKQPLGYRTSVRDIDERKRAEEELLATRKRAEALAQARTELLANVSHELRSPAHCIAGFAELLLQKPLPGPERRYVELIADQCQSMLRQVEDLLSLSALEAGGVELARAPIDLIALSDALIAGGSQDAAQRGLTLQAEVQLSQRWLLGDGLRIKQILRNLIDNALKFTERGGVTLTLREEGEAPGWLVCEVSDTGLGMETDQIATLLLPFRQGDASSSRRRGGVGLGLAIVERLVRAMQGELTVESQRGVGTTVRVRLPFVVASPAREQPLPSALMRTGRALVVDDSPAARELLEEMLRLCGLSPFAVGSAAAASQALRDQPFDVIFLDYQMPDSDGVQAATQLRAILAERGSQHVPIYIVTANVFANEQLRDARALVDGVLLKPLSRSALSAVLSSLPDAQQLAESSPIVERKKSHARPRSARPGRARARSRSKPPTALDAQLLAELKETRARDGQTLLAKLLPQAERDMQRDLGEARARLEAGDLPTLRRLAHNLAGHAAVVGALRARGEAQQLEQLAAEGAEPAQLTRQLGACEVAWSEALALLR